MRTEPEGFIPLMSALSDEGRLVILTNWSLLKILKVFG